MKKLSLLFILAGFAYGVKAQNAEVVNAYNYHKYKEYDKAKVAIDKAILDPKTGISAKTWYYRGLIYQAIEESVDANVKAFDTLSLDKAIESYSKALELDTKNNFSDDIKKRIPYLQNVYVNKGIDLYKKKSYSSASAYFMKSIAVSEKVFNKIDTTLLFNAALASINAKDIPQQKALLTRLIDLKYKDAEIYRSLSNAYMSEKDTAKGLEILAQGRKEYPSNNNLMIDELNVYMSRGQAKQMIAKMEEAAHADSTNKSLWFALGATYDNMGKKANAETAYKKAISLDKNYFDAYYNLGAMHYNAGVEVYNKVKDLPMSKEKEYNAGKAKYTASFNKSLPYLEQALELMPNDVNTLMSLKEVYAKLDNFAKSGEMKKRIQAINKK